jgi:hypothetical protein
MAFMVESFLIALILASFDTTTLLFRVNKSSILAFEEQEIRKLFLHQCTWKLSLVSTLYPGILAVESEGIGK